MGLLAHKLSADVERTNDVILEDSQDETKKSVTFKDMHLPDWIMAGIEASGFEKPSPIQFKSIPSACLGLDILVQSKSGTGKTLVFVIAALTGIDTVNNPNQLQALIITPTREIAVQAARVAMDIGSRKPDLKVHAFIGGTKVQDDVLKLRKCNVATGTPGRIKQLIEEGHLKTNTIRHFFLDEADKLMDENFFQDVTWIFNQLPENKQVIAVSATYPDELAEIIQKYMKNPVHIRLGENDQVLKGITQFVLPVKFHPQIKNQVELKSQALFHILDYASFSQCLIFSNYALRAESLYYEAEGKGWPAIYIAANQDQKDRLQAINRLKSFQIRLLFTTDLTARGIDAENVDLVINLDVPWDSDTYLHRIGRSGRFGTRAIAITITSEGEDYDKLRKIVYKTGSQIQILPSIESKAYESLDLWDVSEESLNLVEQLECAKNEDYGLSEIIEKQKKKHNKKKKKIKPVIEPVDEEVIDITKAWVPVENNEIIHETTEKSIEVNPIESDGKSDVYLESKDIIQNYLKEVEKTIQTNRAEKNLSTSDEVTKLANEFLSSKELIHQDKASIDSKVEIPKELSQAVKITKQQEKYKMKKDYEQIESFFEKKTFQEGLEFIESGKKVPLLIQSIKKQTNKEKTIISEETIPKSFETTENISSEQYQSVLNSQLFSQLQKILDKSSSSEPLIFSYDLPNPNPHRLVQTQSQDISWLDQWYKEVKENAEYIHDMTLIKEMKE